MTIFVLIPVFNRLAATQKVLECLRLQDTAETLSVVVIDDGSSDGTDQFLKTQPGVVVINGDGTLWWGGAINKGFQYVTSIANDDDWVLLINNDVEINADYVRALYESATLNAPAAIGSVIVDLIPPHRTLSLGPRIDAWNFLVRDILDINMTAGKNIFNLLPVDALSGRGAIYPVKALRAVQGMRPRWLPHYLADYELSMRVRLAGWNLFIDPAITVKSHDDYGSFRRESGQFKKFFRLSSTSYLPALMRFWWVASNFSEKISLPLRLIIFALIPRSRKKR